MKQLAVKGMTRSMVRELTCIGKECYRLSFVILAGANFFGALVLFVLVMRTRDFCRGYIYKRFKEEVAANEKELGVHVALQNSSKVLKHGGL